MNDVIIPASDATLAAEADEPSYEEAVAVNEAAAEDPTGPSDSTSPAGV
jgi:hypothetical protein